MSDGKIRYRRRDGMVAVLLYRVAIYGKGENKDGIRET